MVMNTAVADEGGAAAMSLGAGLDAALEGRRKAWLGSLDEALSGLVGRVEGFDPDRVADDEAVLSAVAATTRIALETHGAGKLDALRGVVLNTAAGTAIDELSRAQFMGFLGQFSDLHLRVLRVLKAPLSAPEVAALDGGGIGSTMEWVVRLAFLPSAPLFAIQGALKDLHEAGLILPLQRLQIVKLTEAGATGACFTPLGDRFLAFIAAPAEILRRQGPRLSEAA